jgi:hypothetical protein
MAEKDDAKPNFDEKRNVAWRAFFEALSTPWILAILGAVLGAFFQERNWRYQNSIEAIKADTKNALDTGPKLTGLTNERYSATMQTVKNLREDAAAPPGLATRERLSASRKEWEVRFTDLLSQMKFYLDAPFDIKDENRLKQAADVDCSKYTLASLPQKRDTARPISASYLLAVLNHCYADIDDKLDHVKPAKTDPDRKQRDDLVDGANLRLQHLWHVNAVLRCVIDGRTLQIRGTQNKPFSLATLFSGYDLQASYDVPEGEDECLRDYRDDPALGRAASRE